MRRVTLVSLVAIGGALGCADAPTTTARNIGPSFAFRATELLDGGGFEGAGNQNIAIETHWAPVAWQMVPSVLELDEQSVCVTEGQCPVGTMTDDFGRLDLPVAPPEGSTCQPRNATDQTGSQCFAVITNANFEPNQDIVSGDVPNVITTLRSAIRGTPPFDINAPAAVPLTAGLEWRLVLDYAFLTSQAQVFGSGNDVATITLSAPGVPDRTVLRIEKDDVLGSGDVGAARNFSGCGSQSFAGFSYTLSLCTHWIRDTITVPQAFVGSIVSVTIAIEQADGRIVNGVPDDNGRASFLAFDNLQFIGGVDEPDVPSPTAPAVAILAATGGEGTAIPLRSTVTDPDGTISSFNWTAPAGCTITNATRTSSRLTCEDDGEYTVLLSATDNSGETGVGSQVIVVRNVPPRFETGFLGLPPAVRTGSAFAVGAEFSDRGPVDTHIATWNFNLATAFPGTVTPPTSSAHGRVEDVLTAPAPGIYNLRLLVVDDDAGQRAMSAKLGVYDPLAGHVGGSGIGTLYGTPVSIDAAARYLGDDVAPAGGVTLTAPAKGIDHFESTSLSYMVIVGQRATIEGFGKRNGMPGYAFTLVLNDPAGTLKPVQARFIVREVGVQKGFAYESPFFPIESGDLGILQP